MRTSLLFAAVFAAIIAFMGTVCIQESYAVEEQEWKYFGESSANLWFYSPENIDNSGKSLVRVWGKALAKGKEGIEDKIRLLQKFGGKAEGYKNYSYTVSLFEIDCPNKRNRVVSVGDYDNKGNVLESAAVENYPWSAIAAGTIIDNLYRIVCPQK